MFLTRLELKELTDCSNKSGQVKWLVSRCWPFEIGAKGYPKVLRSVLVARLGGRIEDNGPQLRLPHASAKVTKKPTGKDVPKAQQVLSRP